MQGHYDELWALATHPSKLEYATAAEDATLRVWDLERRQMRAMAKIEGPIRCAAYSPDGAWIAIGLGSGGKAKTPRPPKCEGKWLVLESEDLELKFAPLQVRHERVTDIKFSPDGRFVAVGNADNFIDVYTVPGHYSPEQTEFQRIRQLKGHSSFVLHIDWDIHSMCLQTNCGAHELLYWRLYDRKDDTDRLRPHQEKASSSMRDVCWATQSCIFGWHLRGIWPEDADGTDINAVCIANKAIPQANDPRDPPVRPIDRHTSLVATADDFGKVKIFRYPCIVPRADHRPYGGHSSHVTNVSFTYNDRWLISTGGEDRAVFQWEVRKD